MTEGQNRYAYCAALTFDRWNMSFSQKLFTILKEEDPSIIGYVQDGAAFKV